MTAVTPQGTPNPRTDRPPWPLVVAVGVTGAVLGYLLGAAGLPGEPEGASAPALATEDPAHATEDTEMVPPDAVRLGDLVPGLEGTLVANVGEPAPYQGLMMWSRGWSSPRHGSIAAGGPISPNASGGQIARLGRAAGDIGPDSALYLGSWSGSPLTPARLGVRSFAWHDTDPSLIAWLEAADEPTGADLPPGFEEWEKRFYEPRELWVAAVAANTPFQLIGDPVATIPGAELLAWGSWGYAVAVPEVEVDPPNWRPWLVVLAPDGEERWRTLDWTVAVSPTGLLLLQGSTPTGELRIASAAENEEVGAVPMEHGVTFAAAFSPDGRRLAFLGRRSEPDGWVVAVWDLDAAGWTRVADLPGTGYNAAGPGGLIRWTPDGRFVLVPGRLHTVAGSFGITFYDTVEDTAHHLEIGPVVHLAFVRQAASQASTRQERLSSDDGQPWRILP
jgi:hypothetical protein